MNPCALGLEAFVRPVRLATSEEWPGWYDGHAFKTMTEASLGTATDD